ncbi:MAG: M20 family metallopeptidase [Synergistaceae bacterium]|jgi:glutamate carboxypeptidase|nr:M20 family metallopeptidase [Synergistaceae bacterium]
MWEIREKAFRFIDSKRDDMLSLWEKLVNMESGTLHKEDVDKVAAFLKETADSLGGRSRVVEFPLAGNGLIVEFGVPTDKPHVCFMGHIDTVFPRGTVSQRPFTIENGKARGPGVLDMKGGVVIQLYAAKALMDAGYSDRLIRVVLAGDEESGHPSSEMPRVFEEQCAGAAAAFNFETGDVSNALVVGRKGTAAYDISVKGVSVHAGREPEKGRSAILEMAHKVIALQALTDYEKGITFNVGTFKGGVARNAVPDYAEIGVDVRVTELEQLHYVDRQVAEVAARVYVEGTTTACVRKAGIEPMSRTPGNEKLFDLVRRVSEDLGFEIPVPVVSGGGSDSAWSVKMGIPTIDQMGVKGQWNHSDREYAVVETLFERTQLAVACLTALDKL